METIKNYLEDIFMTETIILAVVLGVTWILSYFITGAIVMGLFTNRKFLKKYLGKVTEVYLSVMTDVVSEGEKEERQRTSALVSDFLANDEEA
jgi:hypothetical protein